jgi:hypothetical protein
MLTHHVFIINTIQDVTIYYQISYYKDNILLDACVK